MKGLTLWVLGTPPGLRPSTVFEQNLLELAFTQDFVEFSECQVRNEDQQHDEAACEDLR
jgi:hypothetical protein